ncbi:ribokinase [bacterium RCC_150]
MSGRIVVVGSLNADLTIYCERLPLPGETVHGTGFSVNPGGKSANQAVAASKLGGTVSLIGAVGHDSNGDMLLASTAGAGVDVSRVRRSTEAGTGVAVIAVDARGENNIIISAGANGTLAPADIPMDAFDDAAVLCLCLEVPLGTVEAAAKAAHDAGAPVLLNLSPYAEIPERLAGLSDVLLLNAHEAAMFLGDAEMPGPSAAVSDWEPVRKQFAERGLRQVLVTLGSGGSVVLDSLAATGERISRISPTRVDAVDTTGAGDAFTGAVAARLAAGDNLREAARFASVAAALATTQRGTQSAYPSAAEVRNRLG